MTTEMAMMTAARRKCSIGYVSASVLCLVASTEVVTVMKSVKRTVVQVVYLCVKVVQAVTERTIMSSSSFAIRVLVDKDIVEVVRTRYISAVTTLLRVVVLVAVLVSVTTTGRNGTYHQV